MSISTDARRATARRATARRAMPGKRCPASDARQAMPRRSQERNPRVRAFRQRPIVIRRVDAEAAVAPVAPVWTPTIVNDQASSWPSLEATPMLTVPPPQLPEVMYVTAGLADVSAGTGQPFPSPVALNVHCPVLLCVTVTLTPGDSVRAWKVPLPTTMPEAAY